MGSPTFEEAVKSAYELYQRFQRQFPDGKLENWNTMMYKEHYSLDASNRYFTPKRDALTMEHVPFSKVVDPNGVLEEMARMDYIHGEENEVQYYICQSDGDGKKRYEIAQPQTYRIGDIVEIQISFIAVPLKGQKYKMITVLHSIASMDNSFAVAATKKRTALGTIVPKTVLKRRVGYETAAIEAKASMMDMGV